MDLPSTTSLRSTRAPRRRAFRREFEAAYREHFGFVWRALVRLGVPWDEAEDAVQEVFVVAYRRWGNFDGRSTRRTWLFAIARRVASHHRRGQDRLHRRRRAYGQEVEHVVDGERKAHERHAASRLQAFLAHLDPSKREVFLLADLEGFTGREIAAALGINPNTAWSRLKAARTEFARAFGRRSAGKPSVVVHDLDAPPHAQARVWAVLMPRLAIGKAGAATGTSLLQTWALGTNLKAFAAIVGLGAATLGTVEAVAPTDPATEVMAAAIVTESPSNRARGARASPQGNTRSPSEPPVLQRPAKLQAELALQHPSRSTPATIVQTPSSPSDPELDVMVDEGSPPPSSAELELLHRAQGFLEAGRPRMALLALAQLAKKFPGGSLTVLRRVTRVEALCAADRRAKGIGEAYRLVREQQRDARLVARMQQACGLKSLEAAPSGGESGEVARPGAVDSFDPFEPAPAAPAERAPATDVEPVRPASLPLPEPPSIAAAAGV